MAIKTSAVLEEAVHRIPIAELTSGAPLFEWTIPPPSSDRRARHKGIQFELDNYQIALVSGPLHFADKSRTDKTAQIPD